MDLVDKPVSEEDERKMKNLATRIMSNGVEVLVKDKNGEPSKKEQVIIFLSFFQRKSYIVTLIFYRLPMPITLALIQFDHQKEQNCCMNVY